MEPLPDDDERWLQSLNLFKDFADDQPDVQAPPVKDELLQRYVDGQLDRVAAERVRHLISQYRAWYEGFRRVVRGEKPTQSDPPRSQ